VRTLFVLSFTVLCIAAGGSAATSTATIIPDNANYSISRAIKFAGPIFGVSINRLHYRVSREGGHGAWVPNRYGSGAGGWFQFMSGTFYAYVHGAFRAAARRGYYIPDKFKSWYSPLGQAVTASYMFYLGLECAGVGWAASC
jgi:hypothetical protein